MQSNFYHYPLHYHPLHHPLKNQLKSFSRDNFPKNYRIKKQHHEIHNHEIRNHYFHAFGIRCHRISGSWYQKWRRIRSGVPRET
jgi:hypothetical protein